MIASCIVCVALIASASGTAPLPSDDGVPYFLEVELQPRTPAPHPVPWTPGRKAATDWAAIIDATWDPVHTPTEQLSAFSAYWNEIDQRFACFHDIDDLWQDQWDHYRFEVEPGVSRGRFAGILGHMSLTLRESHTRAYDTTVRGTFAGRGVPLLYVNGIGSRAGDLGAAVTAQDDGTGLVYRVHPDNPLGLAPGDVILGYDGRPWQDCLDELLEAELPLTGTGAARPRPGLTAGSRPWDPTGTSSTPWR